MPEKIVEKPVSRRRKYTSHTLREALTDRLEEKPLQQITVVELCERADVNRTTFYRNYESMEQLRDDALYHLFSQTFLPLRNCRQFPPKTLMREALINTKKNRRTIKILICQTDFRIATEALRENLSIFQEPLRATVCSDDEAALIYSSFCSSICTAWLGWVENDCRISIEHMEQIIFAIIISYYDMLEKDFKK